MSESELQAGIDKIGRSTVLLGRHSQRILETITTRLADGKDVSLQITEGLRIAQRLQNIQGVIPERLVSDDMRAASTDTLSTEVVDDAVESTTDEVIDETIDEIVDPPKELPELPSEGT